MSQRAFAKIRHRIKTTPWFVSCNPRLTDIWAEVGREEGEVGLALPLGRVAVALAGQRRPQRTVVAGSRVRFLDLDEDEELRRGEDEGAEPARQSLEPARQRLEPDEGAEPARQRLEPARQRLEPDAPGVDERAERMYQHLTTQTAPDCIRQAVPNIYNACRKKCFRKS